MLSLNNIIEGTCLSFVAIRSTLLLCLLLMDKSINWLSGAAAAATAVTSVVSNSVQPHRWQPTRLHLPWDSPGKNTGVDCHFLLQCMKVKSLSRVRLFATPWTVAYQAPPSMGYSRQEYWSGLPSPYLELAKKFSSLTCHKPSTYRAWLPDMEISYQISNGCFSSCPSI